MNILLATALFILLSPGVLLTIFPNGKAIFSGKATVKSVLIHAAIFAGILFAASQLKEGFASEAARTATRTPIRTSPRLTVPKMTVTPSRATVPTTAPTFSVTM